MQFAPSTYYAAKTRPPSDRALSDAELGPKLAELWQHNYSVYGRRKLWKAARRADLDVGRDQVARLMRAEGIRGGLHRADRRRGRRPVDRHHRRQLRQCHGRIGNGTLKIELHRNPAALAANGGPWKGLDDLEIATCAWVSWFNEERLHSELDDQTPAEFEADYRQRSQPDVA